MYSNLGTSKLAYSSSSKNGAIVNSLKNRGFLKIGRFLFTFFVVLVSAMMIFSCSKDDGGSGGGDNGGGGDGGGGGGGTVPNPPTITVKAGGPVMYPYADISWTSVSGATGYKIFYNTKETGTYSLIATVSSYSTYYWHEGMKKGFNYYKVKAFNDAGDSDFSNADWLFW